MDLFIPKNNESKSSIEGMIIFASAIKNDLMKNKFSGSIGIRRTIFKIHPILKLNRTKNSL